MKSMNNHVQDLIPGIPYKVNIYAIVEDSGIPVESKELHDKVSPTGLPQRASLLDINPGPVESKPLHEKVQTRLLRSLMNVKVCTKGIMAFHFNMPAAVIHQPKNQIHVLYICVYTLLSERSSPCMSRFLIESR